ncbi:MAG: response regulator transcription factor [Solirubrobacteraceae bacterium]
MLGRLSCRVIIADDVDAARALFRIGLEADDRIEVVAEACNGAEAVEAVLAHRPDVLLTDLGMPVMDGLQVLIELRELKVPTKVVVLTGFARDRLGPLVMESGAVAYLEKGATREVICRTVLDACSTTTS